MVRVHCDPLSHLENHTTKNAKREINLSKISHGKNWSQDSEFPEMLLQDISERSSEQEHRVDAKAPFAEEGRG